MTTKLTLSADVETIRRAKKLAARQGISLSAMFDRLIKAIDAPPTNSPKLGRLTREAMGMAGKRTRKPDRQLVEEALAEKYGISA